MRDRRIGIQERIESLPSVVLSPELFEPFERAWRHRELIRAVARREFISRFRGSALGPLWAVISPLIMMLTYTAVFSVTVPQLAAGKSITDYAAGIFVGLIIFNLFSELAYRAPMLLHEHVNFVKKSIFPSETIAWTATIRTFTYGGIAFLVFLVFRLLTGGVLHWSVLFTPFLVVPFALMILGVVWFFMALGAFTRDVAHIMASIVPILMFATPVFYSLDQLPPNAAVWLRLNLIGDYIEMFRAVTIEGRIPNLLGYLAVAILSYAIFWGGYQFFMRYKSVIVDVI
ncbi:ABC transporter permease [Methylocystis heyeri]|uniref:ABC transporter n=1 Tax=Methylocystis heyeri TaxID=391905 RepID=A0A6B8KHR5_9HYPH|nr:ABC transporter permease [Methylocystis heyeri]QGM46515.1 ABC transporter [Methylocystis heyeri]